MNFAIIKEQTSLGLGAGNYIRNVMTRAREDKAESAQSDHPVEHRASGRNTGLDGCSFDC